VDVAIGEYDLVVRYVADGPDVPAVVAVALSRLLGGTPTTLTVIDAETQTGSPPPSARGIRLATDLQASGHDGAVRRAQAVLGSGPGAASSEA